MTAGQSWYWQWVLLLAVALSSQMVHAQGDWKTFGHNPDMALYQLEDERIATVRCRCAQGGDRESVSLVLDSVISWNLACAGGRFHATARLADRVILTLVEDRKQLRVGFGKRSYRVQWTDHHAIKKARVKESPYFLLFRQEGESFVVAESRLKLQRHERRNIDEAQLVDAYRKQLLLVLPKCSK